MIEKECRLLHMGNCETNVIVCLNNNLHAKNAKMIQTTQQPTTKKFMLLLLLVVLTSLTTLIIIQTSNYSKQTKISNKKPTIIIVQVDTRINFNQLNNNDNNNRFSSNYPLVSMFAISLWA